jgi:hypothetical protein
MRTLVLLATTFGCLTICSTSTGSPVVLPSPKVRPGETARLEVVAPAGASACSISLRGGGRRYGPYRVSLGGPTRMISWSVPAGASGSWKGRLGCRGEGRRGLRRARARSLGVGVGRIVVGRPGLPRGRLVRRRSLRVGPGSIPEMPAEARLSITNPFSDDVDTTRRDEPFVPCVGSEWVVSTRTTGEGVGTLIQMVPTTQSRQNALGFWNADNESNPVYGAIWRDLNRCAHFSSDMTPERRHVMYVQMACHARYGLVSARPLGGNTWDLEAWRANVDWARGLSVDGRCGNNYGTLDERVTGSFLVGRIVNARAWARPNPAEEIKAWLVLPGAPKPYRRHISTLKAYNCLAAKQGKAQWFPHVFLETYVDVNPNDIGDIEACSSPAVPPSSSPAPPAYVEQQGSLGANTFTNPYNASGIGVKIPPYAYVEVSCKIYAPQIVSANPDGYWYRIRSAPWNDAYYAVANTFWNGDIPGQKPYVHNTDFNVRDC